MNESPDFYFFSACGLRISEKLLLPCPPEYYGIRNNCGTFFLKNYFFSVKMDFYPLVQTWTELHYISYNVSANFFFQIFFPSYKTKGELAAFAGRVSRKVVFFFLKFACFVDIFSQTPVLVPWNSGSMVHLKLCQAASSYLKIFGQYSPILSRRRRAFGRLDALEISSKKWRGKYACRVIPAR